MANPESRLPENVAGAFYVTSDCIDCDICRQVAPSIYQRNADIGYSVVVRQPETEAELRLADEGLEGCPVEAIGMDATALSPALSRRADSAQIPA
jgi:ferredoxin